jgi:hypothetical protein
VVTVVRPGFYFVCGGDSLCWSVRVCLLLVGKEEAWFYERWVFMRVLEIVFGNTVCFSFKFLFATGSENSL